MFEIIAIEAGIDQGSNPREITIHGTRYTQLSPFAMALAQVALQLWKAEIEGILNLNQTSPINLGVNDENSNYAAQETDNPTPENRIGVLNFRRGPDQILPIFCNYFDLIERKEQE